MQLDTHWFGRFEDVFRARDEYGLSETLIQYNVRDKKTFLIDEVENPSFKYVPKIDVASHTRFFSDLRTEILSTEKNEVVQELYNQKLIQQIARIRMLIATIHRDDAEFYAASVELYGQPKKKYFTYVAMRVCEHARNTQMSGMRGAAAKRLLKIFSKIDTKKNTIDVSVLPPVVNGDEKVLTSQQARQIFESRLKEDGISGWRVVVDRTRARTHFSVSQQEKTVNVPNSTQLRIRKKPFTVIHAKAIAAHEIGVHVQRAENGARSPLKLLGVGLDRYMKGEEGLATFMQQQVEGATEFAGFEHYLAASLAVGLDGKKRDFRSVYAILMDYFLVVAPEHEDESAISDYAEKMAWRFCVRIFRGTTGRNTGYIFTKDIVYLEGNVEIWDLMTSAPERFSDFFVGKYDPLNKQHLSALQALGILPQYKN